MWRFPICKNYELRMTPGPAGPRQRAQMIAATSLSSQFTGQSAGQLCTILGLDPALAGPAIEAGGSFALRVTRGYFADPVAT
jgi:hypothetical protein